MSTVHVSFDQKAYDVKINNTAHTQIRSEEQKTELK